MNRNGTRRRRNIATEYIEARDEELPDAAAAENPVRVSIIQCLINTNQSGGGWPAVHELAAYLREELFTRTALEHVLVMESGRAARDIMRVRVQAPSIEEGPQRGFIHAHFTLHITHSSKLLLGHVAPAMTRHVRTHSIFVGAFASVRLLNGRPDNYALKGVTRKSAATFLREP